MADAAVTAGTIRVTIVRSDPAARSEFDVPREDALVVLDLVAAAAREDPSLAFRYSCRSGFCGTCTVQLDGRPVLACETPVPAFDQAHLAPLGGYPVVRDLLVDPTHFSERWDATVPWLAPAADDAVAGSPRPLDPAGRAPIAGSLDCISCGACFAACDVSSFDRRFLGPAALTRAMVATADVRDTGRIGRLVGVGGPDGVEGCHGIGACSIACPRGLDPARAIRRLRRWRLGGLP